jgi:hypothetical protein
MFAFSVARPARSSKYFGTVSVREPQRARAGGA